MVQIKFYKNDFGYYRYKATDHAGDPLVCSACSALGMALVGMLQRTEGLVFNDSHLLSGFIYIDIQTFHDDEKQKLVDTVFDTIYVGLKQVENTYPNNLKVELET